MGGAAPAMSSAPSSLPPVRRSPSPRPGARRLAFLEQVDGWLGDTGERVSAILDHRRTHRAVDVLLWALMHPRWACVFQPKYAASLNLIEPWWKILRSLALTGRGFATWVEVCGAIAAATI